MMNNFIVNIIYLIKIIIPHIFNKILSYIFYGNSKYKIRDIIQYFDKNGKLHRDNGPAVKFPNGDMSWYHHGELVRNYYVGLGEFFYKNRKYHRDAGPAISLKSGNKAWYQNGELHRLDGPALEWDGMSFWFYQGKRLDCVESQSDFDKYLKLKEFW